MNDHKEELIKKIRQMSLDELMSYDSAAKATNSFINIFSISLILLVLIYTNIFTVILGCIIIYFTGNLGAGLNDTRAILREQIEKHIS